MNKKKVFELARGFRGRAKNCIRIARERVEKALQYSYRDRRNKKRDMRSLWIQRINAGTRVHGVGLLLPFLFLTNSIFYNPIIDQCIMHWLVWEHALILDEMMKILFPIQIFENTKWHWEQCDIYTMKHRHRT
jgi:large subunit ribosomal protein L20